MSCTDAFPWLARQGRTTAVGKCFPSAKLGTLLCAGSLGIPCGVLSVPRAPTSKASNRPLGSVDAAASSAVGLRKKLLALGAAFNVLRHMNSVRAERCLAELEAEVHVKTTDPASYTLYADAATCAATAAPAPVNELAVSTRMSENVAPAPVATLLEPPAPSVHVVQVPHIHVVQNCTRFVGILSLSQVNPW